MHAQSKRRACSARRVAASPGLADVALTSDAYSYPDDVQQRKGGQSHSSAEAAADTPRYKRQWRDYRTRSGRRLVRAEIMALPSADRASVTAAMADVAKSGKKAARHLRGEIFEVRAEGGDVMYRLLFATEGRYSQVLLALTFFVKKTQKTPPAQIELAEQRLGDWRARGTHPKA